MQRPGVKNFFTGGSAAMNWTLLRSAVDMSKLNMNTHFRSAALSDRTNTPNASSAHRERRMAWPGKTVMEHGAVRLVRMLLQRLVVVTPTDRNPITATSSKYSKGRERMLRLVRWTSSLKAR